MPAIDKCEQAMIRAFAKSDWHLIDKPFTIRLTGRTRVLADLRLQRISDDEAIIVVEVKCFHDEQSRLDDFYQAVGQMMLYQSALDALDLYFPLFLAIPHKIYVTLFQMDVVKTTLKLTWWL
ncbi:MAG: element excision factor XisH family protein [Chloroflexota bacterium]|nr:element excision factor XisH family protein [Chloroflexota bacterium]